MILYKFKGAACDLYFTDRTWEIIEHKRTAIVPGRSKEMSKIAYFGLDLQGHTLKQLSTAFLCATAGDLILSDPRR